PDADRRHPRVPPRPQQRRSPRGETGRLAHLRRLEPGPLPRPPRAVRAEARAARTGRRRGCAAPAGGARAGDGRTLLLPAPDARADRRDRGRRRGPGAARRPLPNLGPAADASADCRLPVGATAARIRERPPLQRRPALDPSPTARRDRARDRRLCSSPQLVSLPEGVPVTRLLLVLTAAGAALALAACGSSSHNATPTIQKVLLTQVADFKPSGPVVPGKPVTVSFRILQPNAAGTKLVTMTKFRRGAGPHTGVHMIIVRDDLGVIIHQHPPVRPDGVFTQQVTFPKPGPYRVVLDVYPASGPQTNFQLLNERIHVTGRYEPQALPAPSRTDDVDGYHFHIVKVVPSPLKAIQSALMYLTVTDRKGKPVTFVPWFGALAHAIFFHAGRFEYFHTH